MFPPRTQPLSGCLRHAGGSRAGPERSPPGGRGCAPPGPAESSCSDNARAQPGRRRGRPRQLLGPAGASASRGPVSGAAGGARAARTSSSSVRAAAGRAGAGGGGGSGGGCRRSPSPGRRERQGRQSRAEPIPSPPQAGRQAGPGRAGQEGGARSRRGPAVPVSRRPGSRRRIRPLERPGPPEQPPRASGPPPPRPRAAGPAAPRRRRQAVSGAPGPGPPPLN